MKIFQQKSIIFLIIIFLSIISCEKKDVKPQVFDISDIEAVKKAYNNKILKIPSTTNNTRQGVSRAGLEKVPLWKKSYIKEISLGNAWIVPLRYTKNLNYFQSNYSLEKISYLMVYLFEEQLTFEIVTALPDLENNTSENHQWQGTLLVEDLGGNLKKGYQWKDGKLYQLIPAKVNSESNLKVEMYCETTDWYTCISYDGGQTFNCPDTPDYSEKTCTYRSEPNEIMNGNNVEYNYTISDDYNPGGDGSITNPDDSDDPSLPDRGELLKIDRNLLKIMECEELTNLQFEILESVLDEYLNAEYLNTCLNNQVYNYLIMNNKKVCFKMDANLSSPGGYSQKYATMYFKTTTDINETTFGEEFFHIYQEQFYGELPVDFGRSNIEFEAKLFHDLSHDGLCCLAFWDPIIQEEYVKWIRDITNWYSKMPSWNDMSEKYFYFIEKFVKLKPEYDYPIDYSMKPKAIFNLNDCLQ